MIFWQVGGQNKWALQGIEAAGCRDRKVAILGNPATVRIGPSRIHPVFEIVKKEGFLGV